MENSRNKEFISFKYAILSSMQKSRSILFCPTKDLFCVHAVTTSQPLVTYSCLGYQIDIEVSSACVQVTLIYLIMPHSHNFIVAYFIIVLCCY